MLLGDAPPAPRPVALVPLGEVGERRAELLAQQLRRAGFSVHLAPGGNLKKRMKRADKANARAAVLLGDDEIDRGVAAVRDLDTGDQRDVPLDALEGDLRRFDA
jgi:histidyl-tRNA synthetase